MTHVTGDRELEQQLLKLARRDTRRVVRNATNKGLTHISKAIRQQAPVGKTKAVRKTIGKRFARSRQTGQMEAKAGIDVGKRNRKGTKTRAPHAHLSALGTKERFTQRGASRGVMPQNDFVTRGFQASQATAAGIMTSELRSGIEKAVQ